MQYDLKWRLIILMHPAVQATTLHCIYPFIYLYSTSLSMSLSEALLKFCEILFIYLLPKIQERNWRTVGEIWFFPSFRIVTKPWGHSNCFIGTFFVHSFTKSSSLPPDLTEVSLWAGIVNHFTTTQCHLCKLAVARVAATPRDTASTVTLTRCFVTQTTIRAELVTVTGNTSVALTIMAFL